MEDLTRREALRLGGATAALAATGSMAGCSSIPFIGGAGYTNWLFAPGTIGDVDHYNFGYTDVKRVRNNEDEFDDQYYDSFESNEDSWPLDQTGVDVDDVDSQLSLGSVGRVAGSFAKDEVTGDLEDEDFEHDTDHEGYAIYHQDDQRAVGVKENEFVHARLRYGTQADDARDVVETLIDTNAGDEDRYVDDSEDFKKLTDELGSGTFVSGGTQEEVEETNAENGQFEGAVASGYAFTVNGETSDLKHVYVFSDEGDVDMGDVEDWTDGDDFDDVDDVSSSQSGRVVTVTGSFDTDEYGV